METENLQRELKKCFNFKKDKFVTFLKVLGSFVITIVRGYMYIYVTFMDVLWHICCSKGACVTQWSYEPCNAWLLKTGHSEEFWQIMIQRRSKWQPTPVFFLWEALNSMKMQKDMTLESVQYATGEEWMPMTNSSRQNEVARPKWKWCSVVDVSQELGKVYD